MLHFLVHLQSEVIQNLNTCFHLTTNCLSFCRCSMELSSSSKVLSSLASFSLLYESRSSDHASTKGPALIPMVGNNTERGGELVLVKSIFFFISIFGFIYATSMKVTCVYMQLCLRQLAYIHQA